MIKLLRRAGLKGLWDVSTLTVYGSYGPRVVPLVDGPSVLGPCNVLSFVSVFTLAYWGIIVLFVLFPECDRNIMLVRVGPCRGRNQIKASTNREVEVVAIKRSDDTISRDN